MQRYLAILIAVLLALTGSAALADAGYSADELNALTETTVIQSADSPTGFFVTFRCDALDAARVRLKGNFRFTDYAHASVKTSLNASPFDWQDGYFNYGDDYYCEMERDTETGVWSVTLPLPGGTYSYNFYVGGEAQDVADVTDAVKADDPAHPCLVTGFETKSDVGSSSIYVPRDADRQPASFDLTLEAPRADGQTGSYFFESLEIGELTVPYGVYLPHGYDADRAEPYPVLVMLHGGGGSESNWFNDGLTHIMDNLICDHGLEQTIVVTPSWSVFGFKSTEETMEQCYDMIKSHLFPLISEQYNGATDAAHRALGGLSQGGARTMYMAYYHPELCDYYFGYSCPWDTEAHGSPELNAVDYQGKTIFVGCGLYDFVKADCYLTVNSFGGAEETFYKHIYTLADAGVRFYSSNEPPYGHSWQTWRHLAAISIGNYLWN